MYKLLQSTEEIDMISGGPEGRAKAQLLLEHCLICKIGGIYNIYTPIIILAYLPCRIQLYVLSIVKYIDNKGEDSRVYICTK